MRAPQQAERTKIGMAGWGWIFDETTEEGESVDPQMKGGIRICLSPDLATCCFKPVASWEDTHASCFSSPKCYLKLSRSYRLDNGPLD